MESEKNCKTNFNTINKISIQKKGEQMKRVLFLSLMVVLLVFTACQNEGPVYGPELNGSQKVSKAEPTWIGLPQNADVKLSKSFGTSAYVTVADGGQLVIDETYTSTEGKTVHAFSSISFAPGCVQEDVNITMDIDDQTGVSTFMPHQVFNTPAILNQTFTGLNLSGIDVSNLKLYYMIPDGTYEVMECDQLIIDVATGTITVVNGKIPHFSLYGFGI